MTEIKIGIRQALILYASPEFINVRSTGFSRNRGRSMLWLLLIPLLGCWSDHDSG